MYNSIGFSDLDCRQKQKWVGCLKTHTESLNGDTAMVYVSLFSGNFFEIDGCEAGWTAAMWKAAVNLSETWN